MKTTSIFLSLFLSCIVHADDSSPQDAGKEPAPETENANAAKADIVGSSWKVMKIEGKEVLAQSRTYIQFQTAESVIGAGGVNRFFGSCKIDGNQLSFGALGANLMGGEQHLMDQEQRFHAALAKVRSFKLAENNLLHFFDADSNEIVLLSRMEKK